MAEAERLTTQGLEQQIRQAVDPTRPDIWRTEGRWQWLRVMYWQAAFLPSLFLSLEKPIKKAAQKYERNPQAFSARLLNFLIQRRIKRLGLPSIAANHADAHSTSEQLSRRQLKELSKFASMMKQVFHGGPEVAKTLRFEPKDMVTFWGAFARNREGRPKASRSTTLRHFSPAGRNGSM